MEPIRPLVIEAILSNIESNSIFNFSKIQVWLFATKFKNKCSNLLYRNSRSQVFETVLDGPNLTTVIEKNTFNEQQKWKHHWFFDYKKRFWHLKLTEATRTTLPTQYAIYSPISAVWSHSDHQPLRRAISKNKGKAWLVDQNFRNIIRKWGHDCYSKQTRGRG